MTRYALPVVALSSFVITISLGLILSGYSPRPGDGSLLVAFVAGVVAGVIGYALWQAR